MPPNRAPAQAAPEPVKTEGAAPLPSGGGFASWLPLLVTILAMPALAYAATAYLLVPKIEQAIAAGGGGIAGAGGDGAGGGAAGARGGRKMQVQMSKILVNVSGTMGTRYLMTSVTLVGSANEFRSRIEENRDQLLDVAASTLSGKTISDLEKPGARNTVRTELLSVFNNVLGGPLIQELYITEFAIQ